MIKRLNQKPQTLFAGKLAESAANTHTTERIRTHCHVTRKGKVQGMEIMAIYHRSDDPEGAASSTTQMLMKRDITPSTPDYDDPDMIWRSRWTIRTAAINLDQLNIEQKSELHEAGEGMIVCAAEIFHVIVSSGMTNPIEGSFRAVGYWVEMSWMEALPYLLDSLSWGDPA